MNLEQKSMFQDQTVDARLIELFNAKKYQEALTLSHQMLQKNVEYAFGWKIVGTIMYLFKDYNRSLHYLQQAIIYNPNDADSYSNLGATLKHLGRLNDAQVHYREAIRLNPNLSEAHYNLGITLNDLERFDEAEGCFREAIRLKPDYSLAYINLGVALKFQARFDEAEQSYRQAIHLKPNSPEAYSNLAEILKILRKTKDALNCSKIALDLSPDSADIHWTHALLLLTTGDLINGFTEYEWRWKKSNWSSLERTFPKPLWQGEENINGKTVLIYTEQGFGDTIQFCRYISLVSQLGAKIIFEVEPALYTLLQNLPGLPLIIKKGEEIPFFDFHIPLLSLPMAFKTTLDTIPTPTSYLYPDSNTSQEWQRRLSNSKKPKIGLAWSGNPEHKNDNNRSLSLKEFISYLPEQFEYISLQKELRENDQETFEKQSMIQFFGEDLHSFSDTASLCSNLDLVISVDTSVAHLSAAIGIPTWILLPYNSDWRWLHFREDSPWYTSVRLFRENENHKGLHHALSQMKDALLLHF